MARPKNIGEMGPEAVEKSFLEEDPTDVPTEQKVVIAQEIPKMEKIIFQNMRDPGVTLHFHFHSKTHPLKHYDLIHGQEYELPVEVIKHLEGENKWDPYACHQRLYGRRMKADGVSECFVNGYKPYFNLKHVRA